MSSAHDTLGAAVAYIIGTYPTRTTTFIEREIEALCQRGVNLCLISVRRPTASERAQEAIEVSKGPLYLLPAKWSQVLAAHLRWVVHRPGMFFALPIYLLARPHPSFSARVKTLFHFAEGILAAGHLNGKHIVHIHAHFADRTAVVALVAARLLDISYSLFVHANDTYGDPVLLPEKIQHASFVATYTEYNRAYLAALAARHHPRPIELIHPGLNLHCFHPPQWRPVGQHRLLSIGQLRGKDGYVCLIHSCKQLHDRGIDFICDIIGDGPQRSEIQSLIDKIQLADIVHLRGTLSRRQVLARYEKATVFVLAGDANRDDIPGVFFEAMAMRVPVVGTQVPGIQEFIQDGVNGLLVLPDDVNALTDAIARLWDNPSLAAQLAEEGRGTVERDFNIEKNVERLASLFGRYLPRQIVMTPSVRASNSIRSTP